MGELIPQNLGSVKNEDFLFFPLFSFCCYSTSTSTLLPSSVPYLPESNHSYADRKLLSPNTGSFPQTLGLLPQTLMQDNRDSSCVNKGWGEAGSNREKEKVKGEPRQIAGPLPRAAGPFSLFSPPLPFLASDLNPFAPSQRKPSLQTLGPHTTLKDPILSRGVTAFQGYSNCWLSN